MEDNHGFCGCRPPQHPLHIGEIKYSAQQINDLLDMIPKKADRNETLGLKSGFAPDEEDLTAVEVETSAVVKLKDRDTTKGKGYIILRTEKSLVEQMVQENTIYEVRYGFDLGGETLEVPVNCVLDFKGGSFDNGTVLGNNTEVEACRSRIFGDNIITSGTWKIDWAYPEWFGALPDGITDCLSAIHKCMVMTHSISLGKGTYGLSAPLEIWSQTRLKGEKLYTAIIYLNNDNPIDYLIGLTGTSGTVQGFIKDIYVAGVNGTGIKCSGVTRGYEISGIRVEGCSGAGIEITKCWYASFKNIECWRNKYGIHITGANANYGTNGIGFSNVWLNANTEHSLYIESKHVTALSFYNSTFENSTNGPEVYVPSLYNALTFYSCYFESHRQIFKIQTPYAVSNVLLISCFIQEQSNVVIGEFGALETLTMLGCHSEYAGGINITVPFAFTSNAKRNTLSGKIAEGTAASINAANVLFLGGTINNWYQPWSGTMGTELSAHGIRATSRPSAKSNPKIEIGTDNATTANAIYRFILEHDQESETIKGVLKIKVGESVTDNVVFTINQYGKLIYNTQAQFASRLNVPISAIPSSYSWEYSGMIFIDGATNKLMFIKDGVVYDAVGTVVKTYE